MVGLIQIYKTKGKDALQLKTVLLSININKNHYKFLNL